MTEPTPVLPADTPLVDNLSAYGRYVKRVTFRDAEAHSPFCVVTSPILFDGVKVEARISRDQPLRIETRDGLGASEVLTSFVVHVDDVTWPTADDAETEFSIGGHPVCVPPQRYHRASKGKAEDDRYDWALVEHEEVVRGNMSNYPSAIDPVTHKHVTSDQWVRVWLLVKPEFVYG